MLIFYKHCVSGSMLWSGLLDLLISVVLDWNKFISFVNGIGRYNAVENSLIEEKLLNRTSPIEKRVRFSSFSSIKEFSICVISSNTMFFLTKRRGESYIVSDARSRCGNVSVLDLADVEVEVVKSIFTETYVCSQTRRDKMWKHLLFVFVAATTILHETVIAFSLPISQSQSIKQTLSPLAASSSSSSSSSSTDSNTPLLHDLTLFSPCKINLFLRILRKRPDGYHDLASLFQTVAFGDTLHLKMDPNAGEDSMECNMAGVPVDKTNLVLRAIELVKVKTGRMDTFFRANLVKQVPAQAGLGGGSGNAAAAMWGTNVLLGSPATLEQLVDWSAALGSDITFFLSQGTAYCTGRGEIMRPVPSMKDGTKLYIVKPAVGLSTPSVFKALQYDKLSSMDPEMLLDRFLTHGAIDAGEHYYVNDLELPAFICVPELQALKDELKVVKGFKYVMMSGSGSSIFCIGEPEDKEAFNKKFAAREDLSIFPSEFISRKESQWFQAIEK